MDRPSLYDDDIVTWSEEQAAALRALGARGELSNAVDWENVAEEIESVGRSQIHAVEGHLVQLLSHLIKRLSAPSAPAQQKWRDEVVAFHSGANVRYGRSMRQRIDLDKCWRIAKSEAQFGLNMYGDAILPHLPSDCPLSIDDLLQMPFEAEAILLRIAESANAP